MSITLHLRLGDCTQVLAAMPEGSVGAVVSDPPYGLEFMGKEWDSLTRNIMRPTSEADISRKEKYGRSLVGRLSNLPDLGALRKVPHESQEWHRAWLAECYRVLPPGGVLKAFSATRTFHRMSAAMQDAGFTEVGVEAWTYGSGFPKSHNVAVYLDRMLVEGKSREVVRHGVGNLNGRFADAAEGFVSQSKAHKVTTDEAKAWNGWGTALKPSWEPVLVGRKPS